MGGRSIYSWDQDDSRRRRRVNAQPLSALSGTQAPDDAQPAPRAHPGTFGAWRQHAWAEPRTGYDPAYGTGYAPTYGASSARAPQPSYPPPNYQPSSYQPPSYQPPSYQSPSYQPPSYQSPSYQSPHYPPPSYQSPDYPPPSYRQPEGRDSAWLTDQAPAMPRQRTAFWPAVAGQGERAWEQRQRPPQPPPHREPQEDESWLEDTQEDQRWEYTAWHERTGDQRPGNAPPRAYGAPVPPPDPRGQRPPSPYRAAPGAWGQSPDRYPGHSADQRRDAASGGYGAPRPHNARDYDARDAYRPHGVPWGREARPARDWMSSQRDEYVGGYSGGYDEYGEDDADPGVWDEDTAELADPTASGTRFVNMRAGAAAMSGMAAQWGRARPAAQGHGQRRRDAQRWFRRGPNGELKLPPAWMMLNLLILLVAGVIAAPHVFAAETNSCGWYTVQSGDTVPSLAQRYHASAKSILGANHLTTSQQLTAGQRLCIPSQETTDSIIAPAIQTPSATATPKPKPTPTPTPAKPAPAPKTGSVSGAKAFIQFVLPYAKRAHADTGWPTSMIIAQWGVEHGWKLPSFTGYNFGNVASVPGEPTVPGTAAKGSPSRFSYAKTPEDGLRQYLKVAHLKYYAPVTAASKSGANAAALALGKSPWDAGHYGGAGNPGSTLLGVMKSFNLYAYDK